MDPSERFCFFPPPYIAVCPPAPPLFPHQRLPRLRPLPQLPQYGPPYVTWVRAHEAYLKHAVNAGLQIAGHTVLVGRGYCGDAMVPASVICQSCRIPPIIEVEGTWQGDHFHCDGSEMLVVLRGRAEWVSASDGDVPANALPISQSPHGETMYCARGSVNGQLVLGRVMASERACFAMFKRREVAVKNYEVLVIV